MNVQHTQHILAGGLPGKPAVLLFWLILCCLGFLLVHHRPSTSNMQRWEVTPQYTKRRSVPCTSRAGFCLSARRRATCLKVGTPSDRSHDVLRTDSGSYWGKRLKQSKLLSRQQGHGQRCQQEGAVAESPGKDRAPYKWLDMPSSHGQLAGLAAFVPASLVALNKFAFC